MKKSPGLKTLVEMLTAQKDVVNKGVTFIAGSNKEEFVSYAQLYDTALSWLGYLQNKGIQPGDELVFQIDDNKTFIQLFWACILGGIIPVPVALIFQGENAAKLFKIRTFLKNPYLAISQSHYEKLNTVDQQNTMIISEYFDKVLFTAEIGTEQGPGVIQPAAPEKLAFIQFSSGSTGNPKGVVLKHSTVTANIRAALVAHESKPSDSYLSWMPLTHDMGLICFHLYPVGAGVNHYIMPTDLFIRHPLLWIQKSAEYGVSIIGSPNFGYQYYMNRFIKEKAAPLDLSRIKIIVNGAEPISGEITRRFMETLKPFQLHEQAMRPAYGMAEATAEVTQVLSQTPFNSVFVPRKYLTIGCNVREHVTLEKENKTDVLEIVSVGELLEGMHLRITDSEGKVLEAGHIGIIWISGESITSQYYNNEASTKAVIKDGWLNTGDTGFLLDDNLYVVGRVKDMVIVNGMNVYPHDIEQTIETLEGMEPGKVVVCGAADEDAGTETIVAFVVHKYAVKAFLPIIRAVKGIVAARHGLEVKDVIPVRKISKTTSGKVKRHVYADGYRNGEYAALLKEIAAANSGLENGKEEIQPATETVKPSLTDVQQWLQQWLLKHLDVTPRDLNGGATFAAYGLTSLKAIVLAADLEEWLKVSVDKTVIYNFPSIEALANRLSGTNNDTQNTAAVRKDQRAGDTRVAVVGIGCRFPGNVNNPEALWQLLKEQRSGVTVVPAERWDANAYFDTAQDTPGKMYTKWGGFIENVDQFDPAFFGISGKEAEGMDPQQRLLLEVCWEALEHAGWSPSKLRGSHTGIFVGLGTDDYQQVIRSTNDDTYFEDVFSSLGIERSIAAGRIAYLLDFHGPVIQLDTACSSSLVSVHQACLSLLHGDCSVALAGGVNLMLSPDTTVKLCRIKALSPTGAVRAFEDTADGYVRAEGCGIIVLKRLDDALADGDHILAVINGSAVNHDGLSNGLTAPNGLAQQMVIEKALLNALVDADTVQYVEAHGTGTRLGDPIEIQALNTVYGRKRINDQPLIVGALKSNIGHLEAAAGIAGLIKTILCLQHQEIPSNLHSGQPNKLIPWTELAVKPATAMIKWPATTGKRRAGVSSFGLSGTNAHVILEEFIPEGVTEQPPAAWPSYPIVLSAKKPEALQQLATRYIQLLDNINTTLPILAYNAAITRDQFPYRLAVEAASLAEVRQLLKDYTAGKNVPGLVEGTGSPYPPKLAWLFTGGGAQYWGMGKELYVNNVVFRQVVDHCDNYLKESWGFPLTKLLFEMEKAEANDLLLQMTYFQPAIFVISCALATMWRSWGIRPAIVAGHSVGEYAAAYVAGVFSLDDGLKLVTSRARLMQSVKEPGAMATIFEGEAVVNAQILPYGKDLSIAAINGPKLTVISGKKAAVQAVLHTMKQQGVDGRELLIAQASHSPLMEPILEEFYKVAVSIQYHSPQLQLISNVTGTLSTAAIVEASYWCNHIVLPVQFSKSIATIKELGADILMELGPQPNLLSMVQLTTGYEEDCLLPAMQRERSSWHTVLQSLLTLYTKGIPVDWQQFYHKHSQQKITLPGYPFQRKRYWVNNANLQTPSMPQDKPKIPAIATPTTATSNHYTAIRNDLTLIFGELLKAPADDVNVHIRFLELGADSLVLTNAARRIKKKYGLDLTVRQLFEEMNTIDVMAKHIAKHQPDTTAVPPASVIEGFEDVTTATIAEQAVMEVKVERPDVSGHYSLLQRQLDAISQQFQFQRDIIAQQIQSQQDIIKQQLQLLSQQGETVPIARSNEQKKIVKQHAIAPPVATSAARSNIATPATGSNGSSNGIKKHATIFPKIETQAAYNGFSPEQQHYLEAFIKNYTRKTKTSKALTQEYRKVLADNRVAMGFRFSTKEMHYPVQVTSSFGSKITDVDGNEYIDLTMGFGVNLLGHRPDVVTSAVQQQLHTGMQLGPQSILTGQVAKLVTSMTGMDRVSFHNSGTEAVMTAVRLARAVTKKNKIAIFKGAYHGHFDGTLAVVEDMENDHKGVPLTLGVLDNMIADVLLFDYTHPNVAQQIRAYAAELAAVVVEPVQSRNPGYQPKELLHRLREITAAENVVLIFDEMITGFRIHPGGAQAYFDVRADIVTYGKVAGGGLPIGIVAGKREYMDTLDGGAWEYGDASYPQVDTTYYAGTFCKHPLSMAAALALLTELQRSGPALQEQLNIRTARLVDDIATFFKQNEVPIRVQHFGSLFHFYATGNMDLFFYHLMDKGVYIWEGRTCFLSTAHSDEDINIIANAIKESIRDLQRSGFLPTPPTAPIPAKGSNGSLSIATTAAKVMDIPLSFGQERLWFIDQLEGSVQYHIPLVLKLKGLLNVKALSDALRAIVNRHHALRTVIAEEKGKAFQWILDEDSWQLKVIDHTSGGIDTETLQAFITDSILIPFDLSGDHMIRAELIQLTREENVLVLTMHHIAFDDWSIRIILAELEELYVAYAAGETPRLPGLQMQYADYAIQQRNYLTGPVLTDQLAYWKEKLKDLTPLNLPTDFKRPAIQSKQGALVKFHIGKELTTQLQSLSRKEGVTMYMTLLTAFKVLLHRYSGESDICVGGAVAGRTQVEAEDIVGFFVNTLAIRSDLGNNPSFSTLLQQVRGTMFEAIEHQETPFEKVVEAVMGVRDISKNPLFQVVFSLQKVPQLLGLRLGDVLTQREEVSHVTSMFDLYWSMEELPHGLAGEVEYNTDIFQESTLQRMMSHFEILLQAIVENPGSPIGAFRLLGDTEREQLLFAFNDTTVDDPSLQGTTLVTQFEAQVSLRPDAVAVLFDDQQLSYRALNERANQLANYLQSRNVRPETLIPICIERSLDMIVGILGILKAGACYVPIDPEYPAERINYILHDINANLLISSQFTAKQIGTSPHIEVIALDTAWQLIETQPVSSPATAPAPHDLAYVIYTSGSTGKPKGVMIEHSSVVNLAFSQSVALELKPGLRSLQFASFGFDASCYEIFNTLLSGGSLVLPVKDDLLSAERFGNLINRHQIALATLPPSYQHVIKDTLGTLRTIVSAGEPLNLEDGKYIQSKGIRLINAYGPTENTVCTSLTDKPVKENDVVVIGKPIINVTVYIRDAYGTLSPIGVPGEICVGGKGVARGYWNRPDLTAEKFINNPFSDIATDRIYRTGDLGRWLPDGSIEYLGRVDDQVKIRGYRIEPGEIERTMNSLKTITTSCVVAKQFQVTEKKLVGYYVPDPQRLQEKEKELALQQVDNWKILYDTVYKKIVTPEDIDEEFDITGWSDSLSGTTIPAEQMREWLNDITEVILSEKPRHVLEIGSGAGLIYYQLADHIEKYIGTDFSRVSIGQMKDRIQKAERKYPETILQVCAAHEVTLEETENIDLVVLNSIVQYFPSEQYLSDVLDKYIRLLKGNGKIVIGDVRDLRLLPAFKMRLQIDKLQATTTANELEWYTAQEVAKEPELCISPAWFYHLKSRYPEITQVSIQWKQGTHVNELMLYRYTVVIHVGTERPLQQYTWQPWDTIAAQQRILQLLNQGHHTIALQDVPNPRLWKERRWGTALRSKAANNIADLSEDVAAPDEEIVLVNNVLALAKTKGYYSRYLLDEDPFKMNLLLEKVPTADFVEQIYSADARYTEQAGTNIPLFTDINTALQQEIRQQLQEQLPAYMIPAELIALQYLPLTSNGKINRKFLVEWEDAQRKPMITYQAPVTTVEQQLAGIWQELLRIERIGIHDNFFELGGDSIITIQVVSRARRLGYELQPRDLFLYQTISGLSSLLTAQHKREIYAEQGVLTGVSGLLPIQQWFFDTTEKAASHYNQAMLLGIKKQVTPQVLLLVVKQLIDYHDALRFIYSEQHGTWEQTYGTYEGHLELVDFQQIPAADLAGEIAAKAAWYQRQLNIEEGLLVRSVLILTPATEKYNRLLVIIHHLAVDGVSWRILVEDLELLLNNPELKSAEQILGKKSASYRQWQQALVNYSQLQRLTDQQLYWEKLVQHHVPLKVDKVYNQSLTMQDLDLYEIKLNAIQTKRLLQEVPHAYRTEINDILLSALALGLSAWNATPQVLIGLEGHGREDIGQDIDTSRTIGWFTNLYPVLLDIGPDKSLGSILKHVKEQLRQVADKGMGYGVLKYINKVSTLQGEDSWDIVFNYLGQLDNIVKEEDAYLQLASEATGPDIATDYPIRQKLAVNSFVQNDTLILQWHYSKRHYELSGIRELTTAYLSYLEALIAHCIAQDTTIFTPSDYGLGKVINNEELDAFLNVTQDGIERRLQIVDLYRLSSLQEGMLFHGLYDEMGGAYTEQLKTGILNMNEEVFLQSWNYLVERHSILRSAFYYDEFSLPVQAVYRQVTIPVTIHDYSQMDKVSREKALAAYESTDYQQAFNFRQPPLIRITLFRLPDNRHQMLWTFHHMLLDGWSIAVLLEELLNTYDMLLTGKTLPELAVDNYGDYIRYTERQDKEQEASYWRSYMNGIAAGSLLPFVKDTSDRTKGIGTYSEVELRLDADTTRNVSTYAQQHRITVNTVMQGIWAYLLYRYTSQQQICYGVVVSGRPDELSGIEQRIGLYMNTLPLVTTIDDTVSIVEWLKELQHNQLQSRDYQYSSLNNIQRWAGISQELFDSILIFENYPVNNVVAGTSWSLKLENAAVKEQTNYPLSIIVVEEEEMFFQFNFNTALLEEADVQMIANHFRHVLSQITTEGIDKFLELQLLTQSDEYELLNVFNSTVPTSRISQKSIIDVFAQQVANKPDTLAVVTETGTLTYQQLDEQSNRLAHYLLEKGVKTEQLVPVCTNRSMEMIIGILGILKAKAAYVPIDPDFPIERIRYILSDTQANVVLSSSIYVAKLQDIDPHQQIVILDNKQRSFDSYPVTAVAIRPAAENLAYVIYTSGTTGKPKGVMIEHRNVRDFADNFSRFGISSEIRLAATTNYVFDISVLELLGPLMIGGSFFLVQDTDPQNILTLIESQRIEALQLTPSRLSQLLELENALEILGRLQVLLVGGETLNPYLHEKLLTLKNTHIMNVYGPTEATIWSTVYDIEDKELSIGTPLFDERVYILDKYRRLVPRGVSGEIYIAGSGVGRGYWNQAALTAEKFVPDPFIRQEHAIMYKTGDLGKWTADGTIAYLGRIDDQVKIRGYRIELGEIENVLSECGLISRGVVLAKPDNNGDMRLIGYVVPVAAFDREGIISYLRKHLPEYMVPGLLIPLKKLPLSPNGKVDKHALPAPDTALLSMQTYVAPRTEMEQELAAIWQDLLGVGKVGIYDNFFELGGHSLLSMRLKSALRIQLGVELSVRALFSNPTIALLATHIKDVVGEPVSAHIEVQDRSADIPLSFSQERIWFIDQLQGSIAYHLPMIFRLSGKLNRSALANALQTIVDRHEALRTIISTSPEGISQQILDKHQWKLDVIEEGVYSQDITAGWEPYVQQLIYRPFDLYGDHMLRAHLLVLGADEYLLIITVHHIASDGWSNGIVIQELVSLYEAYDTNHPHQLTEISIQYADYAIWQRKQLSEERLYAGVEYWKERLSDLPVLQLPTDYARPPVQSSRGGVRPFQIEQELADQLHQLARQEDVTLFMLLLSAFNVLLYRYSKQEDIAVGSPVAGRTAQELEGLIGCFVNTLVLRADLSNTPSFHELLQQVKEVTLDAYDHQDTPFEKVVEAVVKDRDMSRSPLHQVVFVLHNTPASAAVELGGLKVTTADINYSTAQHDLTLAIEASSDGWKGYFEYRTDLFQESTIAKLTTHFKQLLHAIAADPGMSINKLPILTDTERKQLLVTFNSTNVTWPTDKTIVDLFAEQVLRTPDAIAVVFGEVTLTYQQLDKYSTQLAAYLQSRSISISTEELVPICIDRSPEMIIGILGILKAGAVYVPIDPDLPQERIRYILTDTEADIVISNSKCKAAIQRASQAVTIIALDEDADTINNNVSSMPEVKISSSSLAYIIYTSGSTGNPKGVLIEHRNVVRLFKTDNPLYDFNNQDVWTMFHSFSFDFSVWEMYGALLHGGRLVIVPKHVAQDTALFGKLLIENRVTVLNQTPSAFYVLQDYLVERKEAISIRYVIFGGESLNPAKLKPWFELYTSCRLINMYGITETTVHVTYQPIGLQQLNGSNIIGKPIPTLKVHILDDYQQLVPIGVPGEIYVGGAGVARGYLKREELTRKRFISNLFGNEEQEKYYRTGDVGRWLEDGTIEYLGRIDDQVKIRGFRIELGEVENVLLQSELISQVVVVAKTDLQEEKRLVAYLVPEGNYDKEGIFNYLKSRLPDYMIPSVLIPLDKLPVTSNGKIDKRALPEPDARQTNEYIAPRNGIEQHLITIWEELLNKKKIGIYDNFFELGGHSLLATRVVSVIRKQLDIELSVRAVFAAPSVAQLADYLQKQRKEVALPPIVAQPRPVNTPLSFLQQYLWLIDRLRGSRQFHMPNVWRLKGDLDKDALEASLQTIIDRHEALRTVIREENGQLFQDILGKGKWQLTRIDLPAAQRNTAKLQKYLGELFYAPFDLTEDYMLRAHLIRITKDEHILLMTTHHIASDGWSVGIMMNELIQSYNVYVAGLPALLEPLGIQYADYAIWQRVNLEDKLLLKRSEYWENKLRGVSLLQLPTDYERPLKLQSRGALITYTIDSILTKKLELLSQHQDVTLFMTLLAAFNVLLYHYSGEEDICVGSVSAGRTRQETEKSIGLFLNLLALRNDAGGDPSFAALLQQVKETTLEAYEHQDITFDSLTVNPVFNIMFVLQNTPEVPAFTLGNVTASKESLPHYTSQYDMGYSITQGSQGLTIETEYNTDLFKEETIVLMLKCYEAILSEVVGAPEQKIQRLSGILTSTKIG